MIVMAVSLISSTTAGQIQVAQNKADIIENKSAHDKSDASIVLLVQAEVKEAKESAKEAHAEVDKEIEKLKVEQQKQTEIRVNQKYMREDMKELKQGFKEILIELRSKP